MRRVNNRITTTSNQIMDSCYSPRILDQMQQATDISVRKLNRRWDCDLRWNGARKLYSNTCCSPLQSHCLKLAPLRLDDRTTDCQGYDRSMKSVSNNSFQEILKIGDATAVILDFEAHALAEEVGSYR